jgi:hypothetical protein
MSWADVLFHGPRLLLLLTLACYVVGTLYYLPPGEVLGNPPTIRNGY